MKMSQNHISPLIIQNRLLGQARSGARARSAAIGSAMNRSSNSNSSSKASSSSAKKSASSAIGSKTNYTAMKDAGESIQARVKKLQEIYNRQWDELTGEEAAKYRSQAETEIEGFVSDYNRLITSLSKEGGNVNSIYLKQLQDYYRSAKSSLSEAGILQNNDGTLSVDKEALKKADISLLQKTFGSEGSFAGKVKTRAENIVSSAQTNLSLLNKSMYTGSYGYDRSGSDIFDLLTGGGSYSGKG